MEVGEIRIIDGGVLTCVRADEGDVVFEATSEDGNKMWLRLVDNPANEDSGITEEEAARQF